MDTYAMDDVMEMRRELNADLREIKTGIGELKDDNRILRSENGSLRVGIRELGTIIGELGDDIAKQLKLITRPESSTPSPTPASKSSELFDYSAINLRMTTFIAYCERFFEDLLPICSKSDGSSDTFELARDIDAWDQVKGEKTLSADAVGDARMLSLKCCSDEDTRAYQCLYGLEPSMVLDFASNGCVPIIDVLNAAGSVHYKALHMKQVKQRVLDNIIDLVCKGNLGLAEDISDGFPFER